MPPDSPPAHDAAVHGQRHAPAGGYAHSTSTGADVISIHGTRRQTCASILSCVHTGIDAGVTGKDTVGINAHKVTARIHFAFGHLTPIPSSFMSLRPILFCSKNMFSLSRLFFFGITNMIGVDSCVFLIFTDKSLPENQTKRGEIDFFRTISKVLVYVFCSKKIDFRAILRNTLGTLVDSGLSRSPGTKARRKHARTRA